MMDIRIESRPHKLRRALIALAVFVAVAIGINYQLGLDRFHRRVTPPAFQARDQALLRLPTLDKTAPIVFSTSADDAAIQPDLDRGVSLAVASPRPGQPGNVFLTGHSNNWPWRGAYRTIFGNIDQLKVGDPVIIDWDRRYTYRVTGQRVVNARDVVVMNSDSSKHELTLMTCWPPSTTWQRRIVTAELVQ